MPMLDKLPDRQGRVKESRQTFPCTLFTLECCCALYFPHIFSFTFPHVGCQTLPFVFLLFRCHTHPQTQALSNLAWLSVTSSITRGNQHCPQKHRPTGTHTERDREGNSPMLQRSEVLLAKQPVVDLASQAYSHSLSSVRNCRERIWIVDWTSQPYQWTTLYIV